jgi:hypothetical protein
MSMSKQMMSFSMDEQEEDQRPEPFAGMSDDERIAEFIRLDTKIKELSAERRNHASVLTEKAFNERDGQKTVHLQANDGSKVKVEFKTTWTVDHEELEVVRELLKDEKFNELFKTEYTPKLKTLKVFLNTGFSDERWNTAKAMIKECVKEVEQSPYVSVEKRN